MPRFFKIKQKMAPTDPDVLKCLVDNITKKDIAEVKKLLTDGIDSNACDEHGMSLLHHACYQGSKEIVQLLLDQGADVNGGKHEHQYSALHFAALSGKTEVCQLLLSYGAKVNVTNSVGRTASQMAAFVGNHACVATINNFIDKSDVEYYTKPRGQEAEAKLPAILAEPLHKFITIINIHPVKVALSLRINPPLLEHLDAIKTVLELMSEREMKRGIETNEIMSFKLHYFSCVVAHVSKLKKSTTDTKEVSTEDDGSRKTDSVEMFIKKMLRVGRGGDTIDQKQFLVDSIRSFHGRECAIFRQMVTTLARADAPNPASVISDAINGQRAFADSDTECWTCGEYNATKKCSKCKYVRYCDRECQRMHWFVHKKMCQRQTTTVEVGPKVNQDTIKSAIETANIQLGAMGIK